MLLSMTNFRSLADIAIVSFMIYRILVLLVGMKAGRVLKGIFLASAVIIGLSPSRYVFRKPYLLSPYMLSPPRGARF